MEPLASSLTHEVCDAQTLISYDLSIFLIR